ncbi:MAG: alpha-galactosidase, partial [Candidatus Marinimicrobia bacterium]|nr:alpha-galactosidase [Candidatus Neomarinimicrobiota bacterium]
EVFSTENTCASYLRLAWKDNAGLELLAERPREFCTFVNGTRYGEPLAARVLRYGTSENQPFPAQILSSATLGKSVVLGPLSGRVSDIATTYAGSDGTAGRIAIRLDATRFWRGQETLLVKPGATAEGETLYLGVSAELDLTAATAAYRALLRQALTRRTHAQRLNVFAEGRVWGSWNLGLFRNISHDMILEQARIIQATRPDLKWIEIDDGYTTISRPGPFILEPPGIDERKFPQGMKALADGIRALGLKPSLWLGLIINPETVIPEFARDWLLLKKDGTPLMLPAGNKFLDFSLDEVREYFQHVVDTVTRDWGFQGFKLDFWSDHFLCTDIAYRNPEWTGIMLRDWFCSTLRDAVGDDGFLLTCCCVGSGNPFIGQYADCYRCGIDIGAGKDWHGQVSTAFWYAMQAKLRTAEFILPDIDSIGDFTRIVPVNMHRCWVSFAALSGAHVEYGGLLQNESAEYGASTVAAFNWIPLGCMPEPLDFPHPRQGRLAPMLWLNRGRDDGPLYLAVCNWDEEQATQPFAIQARELGLPRLADTTVHEFWQQTEIQATEAREIQVPSIPPCDALVYILKSR